MRQAGTLIDASAAWNKPAVSAGRMDTDRKNLSTRNFMQVIYFTFDTQIDFA